MPCCALFCGPQEPFVEFDRVNLCRLAFLTRVCCAKRGHYLGNRSSSACSSEVDPKIWTAC